MKRRMLLLLPALAILAFALGCLVRGPEYERGRGRDREQGREHEREREHDRDHDRDHDRQH